MPKSRSLAAYTLTTQRRGGVPCTLCKLPKKIQAEIKQARTDGTSSYDTISKWLKENRILSIHPDSVRKHHLFHGDR